MKITAINCNQNNQNPNTKAKPAFGIGSIGVAYNDLERFNSKKEIKALKTIMQKIFDNEKIKDIVKQADCNIELDISPNSYSGDMFYVGMNKPHDFALPRHDRNAYIFNATEIVNNENSIKSIAESIVDIIKLHTGLKKPSLSEYNSEPWRVD